MDKRIEDEDFETLIKNQSDYCNRYLIKQEEKRREKALRLKTMYDAIKNETYYCEYCKKNVKCVEKQTHIRRKYHIDNVKLFSQDKQK